MFAGRYQFNLYLLALLAGFLACGCQSTEKKQKKQLSTLRVHVQVTPDATDKSAPVPIYREAPVLVNVQRAAFLTEADITEARVINVTGGFVMQVLFNQRGTWLLEQYSANHVGKQFAIFSQFGEALKESRWLGAPRIPRRITNGMLVFTPDATREEAEQIALGLNNVARRTQQHPR
jgi:preprotein translocase subunit SecD